VARKGENIYFRKDGRWEGRYIKGKKSDGRPVFGYVYGKKYGEVKSKLLSLKYRYCSQNSETNNFQGTLNDWVLNWFEDIAKSNIKRSTYSYYQGLIQHHILPLLGQIKLNQIKPSDMQQFIDTLLKKGLRPNTVRGVFNLLNRILKKAADNRFLIINPCKDVILPKVEKPKIRILTMAEQQKLEYTAAQDKDGLIVILALYTGMRIGELCALKWSDVDLQEGIIHVRQTIQRIQCMQLGKSKTEIIFDNPKSNSSIRMIPLPLNIHKLLSKVKDNAESEYVIPCNNRFSEPRIVNYRFRRIIEKAGIENVHFHALRHTFATRFMELGIDVTTLSRILGHSSVKMTLDVYTDSLIEHKKYAMYKLDTLWTENLQLQNW